MENAFYQLVIWLKFSSDGSIVLAWEATAIAFPFCKSGFYASMASSNKSLFRSIAALSPLCLRSPLVSATSSRSRIKRRYNFTPNDQARQVHVESAAAPRSLLIDLPLSCPGCGAFTQIIDSTQPGFYSINRKSVKALIGSRKQASSNGLLNESNAFQQVVDSAEDLLLSQLGLVNAESHGEEQVRSFQTATTSSSPICNRCHGLMYHHTASPVKHPTLQSVQKIISQSPHTYNHIYHILDAADFPLSLIPSLQRHLLLVSNRSRNRRARTKQYSHGRRTEMSFIITRSDLLAPKKEQVDSLMPYILQVLRDALAGSAENVRLGNVRCVSSKRGWWTKQVKEDVWNRGGGGWMVGKVNVGKSSLFENIFPKGHKERAGSDPFRQLPHWGQQNGMVESSSVTAHDASQKEGRSHDFPEELQESPLRNSILPPAPPEIPYPTLPLVSLLPGTTVSPIRVPFGGGKGELIDLPGLPRGNLEDFVATDRKSEIVMRQRVKPEQVTIKPGQSLLIGGLVRITATTPDFVLLAYPFVPLKCHVASTERAIAIQMQREDSGVPSIAKPGIGSRMDPAGSFPLKWDVTKQRAGPLTKKEAVGLETEVLPFVVLSIDVLIEGCGWIELIAQVRKKDLVSVTQAGDLFDTRAYPRVEIFSPDGRNIGVRRPMGAWLLCGERSRSSGNKIARPRRSMRGVKKLLKTARRKELD